RVMGPGPARAALALVRFAVLLLSIIGAASVADGAEWEKLSEKSGLLVERRAVPGSQSFEIRVTTKSPLAPATIFDTLWNHREYPRFIPYLKRLDVLSDTGDERVIYEQVDVPLARDRDYTVRVRKRVDAATQRYEILFEAANDAGPPSDGSHLRVHLIKGS